MSKQSAYYQELEEMLAKPGCPLCHVGHKVARSYLENLLWGSVNDPPTRAKLDQTLGFCGQHSRDLLSYAGERLGTAIIQQAMLKEALRRLKRSGQPARQPGLQRQLAALFKPPTSSGDSPAALSPKGDCPVCTHRWEMERRSLEVLVEHLVDDLEIPLEEAGGLCWDHLDRALSICRDQAFPTLAALQVRVWEETIADLGEFIRKRDYRFSHEPLSDAETVSMVRTIAILTGEYPVPA